MRFSRFLVNYQLVIEHDYAMRTMQIDGIAGVVGAVPGQLA